MRWITVEDLDNPASPYADECIEAASQILWLLSGKKFAGQHSVTEVYRQPYRSSDMLTMTAGLIDGQVYNYCSACDSHAHGIWLRHRPVISVTSVYVGATLLSPSQYQILDSGFLGSPGGQGCWQSVADLTVSYIYGQPMPAMAKMAARELANQLVLASDNDENCRLPDRVTSVSRQGVSWAVLDPQDFLADGRTGLYTVDLFLKTVNPAKARARSRVFTPDVVQPARVNAPTQIFAATQYTVASTPGVPFTIPLPNVPTAVLPLTATVRSSRGQVWALPERMLVQDLSGDWSIVGEAGDTALVPTNAVIDFYSVEPHQLTHVARGQIVRP